MSSIGALETLNEFQLSTSLPINCVALLPETKRGRGEKLMGEGEKERVDIYSRRRAGGGMHVPWDKTR